MVVNTEAMPSFLQGGEGGALEYCGREEVKALMPDLWCYHITIFLFYERGRMTSEPQASVRSAHQYACLYAYYWLYNKIIFVIFRFYLEIQVEKL